MIAATSEEIEADAATDVDNPPLTALERQRLRGARLVGQTRKALGLSQPQFARTYGFSLGRLRDLEQGRTQLDSALAAYLLVIRKNPAGVRAALEETTVA
ncbi:MAG: hypothetical protein ABI306_10000 [Caulobacteraceae bacterium]